MTDAPERVWLTEQDIAETMSEFGKPYVSEAYASALVAAALRENCVNCCGTGKDARGHDCDCSIPTDAQAALEAVKAEAREEGFWAGRNCGGSKAEIDAALAALAKKEPGA